MGTGLEVAMYAAYAAAVISAGVSVYSAVDQAQTAKETAKYNNEVADAQARNAEQTAAEEIRRQRAENRRREAAMRNSLASGGYLTSEGTPLAIIGDNSENLELKLSDIGNAMTNQAASFRQQGEMSLWEGDQRSSAAILGGVSSAIGAVGSFAKTYATFNPELYGKKPGSGSGSSAAKSGDGG